MIPQRNLSLLSNRLARAAGRRILEAVLERDYCLAWFLVGLSRSELREKLLFKGGTALKRCYFGDYRFSEDLDFTLAEPMELDDILAGLTGIYGDVGRASGIRIQYARADRKSHQNSHTFYLGYEGPLPAVSAKEVKVDITIREQLVCAAEDRRVTLALALATAGCGSSERRGGPDAPQDASASGDATEPSDAEPAGDGEGGAGGVGGAWPPSCHGLPENCGTGSESCCASPLVTGGTFLRSYDAITYTDQSNPATVSDFRLDKFEVTVGRFRRFVNAVVAGYRPDPGSGKHSHLNGGQGLTLAVETDGGVDADAATLGYEQGWDAAWNLHLHDSRTTWDGADSLYCDLDATWTPAAGPNERRPINCINWFQMYAFCIWDGGFLPSDAEWNYAAAGGNEQRPYAWGTTAPGANTDLAVYGCYQGGTGKCTSAENIAPVGSAPAGNGKWGQADLSGNVWEWSLDGYADYVTPSEDRAQLTTVWARVVRGGGFSTGAEHLLVSLQAHGDPSVGLSAGGVRCAREP